MKWFKEYKKPTANNIENEKKNNTIFISDL